MFLKSIEKHNKIMMGIFLLYSISLFISKPGISLFGGILAIISIFTFNEIRVNYIQNKDNLNKNILYLFFSLFIISVVFQMFSINGFRSAVKCFYKTYYLLILPLTIYLINEYRCSNKIFTTMELALFAGILKSFQVFYSVYHLKYYTGMRVISFFGIGRWGVVVVLGMLFILPNLDSKLSKKNIFSWVVFSTGIISLILNGSRGPLLSFVLGVVFYIIFGRRIKLGITLLALVVILGGSISIKNPKILNKVINRVESVKETKSVSNGARIYMWKESLVFMKEGLYKNKKLFFFGTGFYDSKTKTRTKLFKEHLDSRESYESLDKGIKGAVSFMDAHNSYLNRLLETGIVYTVFYYLSVFLTVICILKNYIKTQSTRILSILSVIVAFAFCGIFYGYAATYETFLFFFMISLGLTNQENLD